MEKKRYKAGEGLIWKSKIDGAYLSDVIILGKEDSIDNYEQVEPPVLEEENDELST